MIGWIVAAFLGGLIAGAVLALRYAPRPTPQPDLAQLRQAVAAVQPLPPAPKVHELPTPEETAHALIDDAVRERMLSEFQKNLGVSEEKAREAIAELEDRLNNLGADVTW